MIINYHGSTDMKRLLGVGGLNRFYERAILALDPAVTNKGFFFILFYLFIYLFFYFCFTALQHI